MVFPLTTYQIGGYPPALRSNGAALGKGWGDTVITEAEVVAALPKRDCFLRDYVRWAARAADANIAYHLLGGLMCLTQAVPPEYGVPFGKIVHPNLYGLVVGPSTLSRKSVAITFSQSVMDGALPERLGDMPGSPEGLIDSLAQNQQQIIYYQEYGAFLSSSERGYLMPVKTRLTDLYDGTPVGRSKANGKGVKVERPRLSIFAGVAPGYLERHTEIVDWTEGFLARHLTFYAKRERYFAIPAYTPGVQEQVVARLKQITDVHRTMQALTVPASGWTPGAVKWWTEWQRGVEKLAVSNPTRMIAPAIGRAPAMALKVAALLAFDFRDGACEAGWEISEEEILYASKIVDLHVKSVLEIGDLVATDRDMRDRRKLLHEIGDRPIRFGSAIKQAAMTKRRGREILETLEEEGTVRRVNLAGVGEPVYVRVSEADQAPAYPEGVEITRPGATDLD